MKKKKKSLDFHHIPKLSIGFNYGLLSFSLLSAFLHLQA